MDYLLSLIIFFPSFGALILGIFLRGENLESNNNAKLICDILEEIKPSKYRYQNLIELEADRPGHDQRYAINSSLITKEINWKPKYDLKTGLTKTIKWYLENLNWCNMILENSNYQGQRIGLRLQD